MTNTKHTPGPWLVVYGETMPIWEQRFQTKREAEAFADKHRSFGDVIFRIARTVSDGPHSIMGAFDHGGLMPRQR